MIAGTDTSNELRVLLVSPLPEVDPPCGDVTYSTELLESPPPGVRYTSYIEALASGALVEHGVSRGVRSRLLQRARLGEIGRIALLGSTNNLRSARLLLWEPLRLFKIKPGMFDLIHVHVFSAGFMANDVPLVTSNALPQEFLYRDARGYSKRRYAAARTADQVISHLLNINLTSSRQSSADRLITFTETLRNWYLTAGWAPARVETVPVFIADAPRGRDTRIPGRIGFVAKDFVSKGGNTLIDAVERVIRVFPQAHLYIVGSAPDQPATARLGPAVTWVPYMDRSSLLNDVMPTFDILAYPTAFDGMPLVLLEAMQRGIPVAASDYFAIPEIVGEAGFISAVGDAEGLAANILAIIGNEAQRARLSEAARSRFSQQFSSSIGGVKLRQAYDAAIQAHAYRRPAHVTNNVRASIPGVVAKVQSETTVIIITCQRLETLRRTIISLRAQTRQPEQVLVVDGSTDDLTQRFADEHPEIDYIRNPLGYGNMPKARNLGLKHARGDIIVFLDDDAYPNPDWMARLIDSYSSADIGGVGGRALNLLPGEDSIGVDRIGRISRQGDVEGNFAANPGVAIDVDHLIGCNMSFRREVLAELGGLREEMSGPVRDDTDLSLRVRALGYRLVFNPQATVVHVGAPQPKGRRFGLRYQYFSARNQVMMLMSNFGARDPRTLRYLANALTPSRQAGRSVARGAVRFGVGLAGTLVGLAMGLSSRPTTRKGPARLDDGGNEIRVCLSP